MEYLVGSTTMEYKKSFTVISFSSCTPTRQSLRMQLLVSPTPMAAERTFLYFNRRTGRSASWSGVRGAFLFLWPAIFWRLCRCKQREIKKANKTSQHARKQASFCSMHKRYQYSFLNQNSARILNNTKTSKRKLSNSLILTKLFKSLLCSVALFGVVGFFGFFLRGHE